MGNVTLDLQGGNREVTIWRSSSDRERPALVVKRGRVLLVRHRGNLRYSLPGGGMHKERDNP